MHRHALSLVIASSLLAAACVSKGPMPTGVTQIDPTASVVVRRQIEIQAPLEDVWKIQADIRSWGLWNGHIVYTHITQAPAVGVPFELKYDGLTLYCTIQEFEPRKRFGWTGRGRGLTVRHFWEFDSEDGNTIVRSEESRDGWRVGFRSKSRELDLAVRNDIWLRNLKREAEQYSQTLLPVH